MKKKMLEIKVYSEIPQYEVLQIHDALPAHYYYIN